MYAHTHTRRYVILCHRISSPNARNTCMCIYINIYMYIYVCTYTHWVICDPPHRISSTSLHSMYIYIYIYIYTNVHTHTHTHILTGRYVILCTECLPPVITVCIYIYKCTHAHTHTHTHTHWAICNPLHRISSTSLHSMHTWKSCVHIYLYIHTYILTGRYVILCTEFFPPVFTVRTHRPRVSWFV